MTLENTELKAVRTFAGKKIRALTVFGAHQNDVMNVLYYKFSRLRTISDDD